MPAWYDSTPRGATLWLVGLLALGGTTACSTGNGDPWGRASFEAVAAFAPPPSRLQDGKIRTARDYLVQLDTVSVSFATISIQTAAEAADLSFDPANPPPQYGLCHNGHCHHEDGRLVDYEDIAAELAGTSAGGETVEAAIEATVTLASEPSPLPIQPCPDGCWLSRGTIVQARLRATGLTLQGVAYEGRVVGEPRLPQDGVPFSITLDGPLDWSMPLDGRVDRGEPVWAAVSARLQVAVSVLDPLDFQRLTVANTTLVDEDVAAAMRARLRDDSDLQIDLSRSAP